MIKLGLIGYPLGHSFSARYFEKKFRELGLEGKYTLMPLPVYEKGSLEKLLADNPDLDGFNVTAPWKRKVMDDMDFISREAREIGGVNVVKVCRNEGGDTLLEGYNTDWKGFIDCLPERYLTGNAIVLGSGGAAGAAVYGLLSRGMDVCVVSREPARAAAGSVGILDHCKVCAYDDLSSSVVADASIVVNATPLGMFPNCDAAPAFPYRFLGCETLCFDMVYNPSETLFMRQSGAAGASVMNGLGMLHRQADLAWEIWRS